MSWSQSVGNLSDYPIHDHKGSDCAFIILEGTSTERTFEIDDSGMAVHTSTRHYMPGRSVLQMSRYPPGRERQTVELVNLHVTPPLSDFTIYESEN